MITGQSPRMTWRPNPGSRARSIEEAVSIARSHGVPIPEDVAFFVDEDNELDEQTTARGPMVTAPAGTVITWSFLVHERTGKVPFLVRPDILESDEAIVAVVAHEMFELNRLRSLLEQGKLTIERYVEHTAPGVAGNLHDQAWEDADARVARMRQGKDP